MLARSMAPAEERMMGMVHQHLAEGYAEERDPEWLMHRAVEGMLESLNDPYTFFVGPEDMVALDEDSSGRLIGIGVMLDNATGHIRYPQVGGPAEAAGIRPGDRIHSLNGEACGDLAVPELVARIKGKVGTVLHMEVEHATGELEAITVERRAVPRITVAKTGMLDEDLGIGVIHIRSFARSTPAELDQALDGLLHAGAKALVLDLRFNTGGLLDAAVDIASRFLEGGIVCRLEVRGGEDQVRFADPKLLKAPHIPIVILANRLSASGSEVLAGALKDRGAALLCGQRTFGKGVYQQVHRYRTGNFALKFTAGYYRTPSGRILEGHIDPDHLGGLEPDLPVALDAASNLALRQWLDYDAPPAKWRDQVQQLFPQIEDFQSPPDSALALALSHLRGVLSS